MGKLVRAVIGCVLAGSLFYEPALWDNLRTPAILALKADIAAQRPGARLLASLGRVRAALGGPDTAQNGTAGHEIRAHRLHS